MEFQIRKQEAARVTAIEAAELEKRMLTWPEAFYQEREPEIRVAMLEEADRLGLTPEDNAIRRALFEQRYPNLQKQEAKLLDTYLKVWMEFRFEVENGSGFFLKKRQKSAKKALAEMGYDRAQTEQEKRLLYQEIRHLGFLYISLCQEDSGYNSVILGFGHLSDEKLAVKITNEFRTVACLAPEKLGMTEELALWTEALSGVIREVFPNQASILAE